MTVLDIREGAEPEGAWAQSAKSAFRFLFLAVCLAAIFWALSGIRRVPPESQAIVYEFGRIVRTQRAGLLLASGARGGIRTNGQFGPCYEDRIKVARGADRDCAGDEQTLQGWPQVFGRQDIGGWISDLIKQRRLQLNHTDITGQEDGAVLPGIPVDVVFGI